ncbi:TniQ family protein [Nocardia sp. 2YAB30]|uniref:hypothetical protein n=1 Tax=Nocardia sp. 2YAB30 TaxID=3233022 RepID=UPI003F9C6CFC
MTTPLPRRLPIAVPPAHLETVASYLARLAALNSINGDELWHRVTRPFPTLARRTVNPDHLAAVTGLPTHHLTGALLELRHPEPEWGMFRHAPQTSCARCDARYPGGQIYRILPHHRYVCTRHRYWIGPPDINHPSPPLEHLDEIVAAQRRHLRLVRRYGWRAVFDAVLTAFAICAHRWNQQDPTIGTGLNQATWNLRLMILIPQGTENRTFSASRLFAPIYPETIDLAGVIAAPHWRAMASGNDTELDRFLTEVRHRIRDTEYEPQGENDPLAHWIETDSPREPTAPKHTFPTAPGHRKPSHIKTVTTASSMERHARSMIWFTAQRCAGRVILHHRTVHPVIIREWSTPMQEFAGALWQFARSERFKSHHPAEPESV